jgi:hypothetical protein
MKNYLRYLYALFAVPLAILLRFVLTPLTGIGTPYVTLFPVTVGVALLAGKGPAILTGILGSIVIDYFFILPLHTLIIDVEHVTRMAVVVLTSAFVGYVGEVLQAARAKAEKQALILRDSQMDLNRAQAVANTGSWRMDVQHNELSWSDENHRIFGISKGTPMTYETFLAAVHPDDRAYVDQKWMAALRGEPYDIEHRIVVDGSIKWVRERANLELDKDGTLLGGFGTTQDITERKRAEKEKEKLLYNLQERVKELNCLYKISAIVETPDISLDEILLKIVNVIPSAWQYPDITCARIAIDKQEYKTSNYKETKWKQAADIIVNGRKIGCIEVFYLEERVEIDEGPFFKEERALITAISERLGHITNRVQAEEMVHQAKDNLEKTNSQLQVEIVYRKQISDDLARSNKDLEQFAYVASHDLQEPLRAISGFVDMLKLQMGGSLDAKKTEYMNYIVDGAARMRLLINGLLEYSRVDTSGKPPELTDCKAALERAILNLQVGIRESGAKVTAGPLPKVCVDSMQLVQLLQNLISNAIKFRGEPAPDVHISASHQDNEWLFAVTDNGIGIEPQYAQRIFLIFQRLHPRSKYQGTGIGLAICRKIVERHGGKIWVESNPGSGSTFYFTIPDTGVN